MRLHESFTVLPSKQSSEQLISLLPQATLTMTWTIRVSVHVVFEVLQQMGIQQTLLPFHHINLKAESKRRWAIFFFNGGWYCIYGMTCSLHLLPLSLLSSPIPSLYFYLPDCPMCLRERQEQQQAEKESSLQRNIKGEHQIFFCVYHRTIPHSGL